ncbi:MAG TPA: DUF350 domain-containing protein, partial [Leptospiraceae bacterium]|nr:DUF350 domain-containing protein [Leptospiraceae bacterium]
ISIKNIINAFLYSGIGIIVLAISFIIFDRITPGNLWEEIAQKNNMPLAVTTSAVTIAMAIIIAAAIHS